MDRANGKVKKLEEQKSMAEDKKNRLSGNPFSSDDSRKVLLPIGPRREVLAIVLKQTCLRTFAPPGLIGQG
jgi:hypothetical protein